MCVSHYWQILLFLLLAKWLLYLLMCLKRWWWWCTGSKLQLLCRGVCIIRTCGITDYHITGLIIMCVIALCIFGNTHIHRHRRWWVGATSTVCLCSKLSFQIGLFFCADCIVSLAVTFRTISITCYHVMLHGCRLRLVITLRGKRIRGDASLQLLYLLDKINWVVDTCVICLT